MKLSNSSFAMDMTSRSLVRLSVGAGGSWCCVLDLSILVPVSLWLCGCLGALLPPALGGCLAVWRPRSTVTDKSATRDR